MLKVAKMWNMHIHREREREKPLRAISCERKVKLIWHYNEGIENEEKGEQGRKNGASIYIHPHTHTHPQTRIPRTGVRVEKWCGYTHFGSQKMQRWNWWMRFTFKESTDKCKCFSGTSWMRNCTEQSSPNELHLKALWVGTPLRATRANDSYFLVRPAREWERERETKFKSISDRHCHFAGFYGAGFDLCIWPCHWLFGR